MVEIFSRLGLGEYLFLSSETTQFNVSARGHYQEIIDNPRRENISTKNYTVTSDYKLPGYKLLFKTIKM